MYKKTLPHDKTKAFTEGDEYLSPAPCQENSF